MMGLSLIVVKSVPRRIEEPKRKANENEKILLMEIFESNLNHTKVLIIEW